ncbi:MAG: tRNA-dihydrouridine synthase, partial [Candidatus Yanofskybacteria bacterium GW2011_GWA1_48_10]
RKELLIKHINNFLELWGTDKNFNVMKRFVKIYISSWPGAKELRDRLMKTRGALELLEALRAGDKGPSENLGRNER